MNKKVLLYKIVPPNSYQIGDKIEFNIQERTDDTNREIKFINMKKNGFNEVNPINIIDMEKYLLLPEKDFIHNEAMKRKYTGQVLAVEKTVLIEDLEQLVILLD